MNINATVINALTSLKLPVHANVYNGTADEYITFNYADERPALRADDTDILDETTIQVHYFTRGNPQTNKKAIRRLLRAADSQFKALKNCTKATRDISTLSFTRVYRGCYRRLGGFYMAKIGLKYPVYAPATEAGSTITYGTGAVLAKAISANISIENNDVKLYADDVVAESDNSFASGTITIGIDDLYDAAKVALLDYAGQYIDDMQKPKYPLAAYLSFLAFIASCPQQGCIGGRSGSRRYSCRTV